METNAVDNDSNKFMFIAVDDRDARRLIDILLFPIDKPLAGTKALALGDKNRRGSTGCIWRMFFGSWIVSDVLSLL